METTKTLKAMDTKRKKDYSKTARKIGTVLTLALSMLVFGLTAFAAGTTDNPAPDGVKTETMISLMGIVWWLVRVAVLIIGGVPSIIKIVQGQSDENPRDRNAGITTLIICAACFGATFAIEALIS